MNAKQHNLRTFPLPSQTQNPIEYLQNLYSIYFIVVPSTVALSHKNLHLPGQIPTAAVLRDMLQRKHCTCLANVFPTVIKQRAFRHGCNTDARELLFILASCTFYFLRCTLTGKRKLMENGFRFVSSDYMYYILNPKVLRYQEVSQNLYHFIGKETVEDRRIDIYLSPPFTYL
jgi:hypothetical protein